MAKKKKKTDVSKTKLTRLSAICEKINKSDWGGDNNDALLFFGEGGSKIPQSERFQTGAVSLDSALGGGWPIGRVCEVYGPESSGKSTLVLHAIAEFQKAFPDDYVALIDSEFSFDMEYARSLGVNVESIIINQPESGEQALNVLEMLVDEGVKMIVVDSVAALTTQAELTSNIGDATVAAQARLMSSGLKKIVNKVSRNKSFVLFTNQVRDKIGVTWGEKTTQPGGRALRFYSSCRVALAAIGKDKEGDEVVSSRIKAVVKKNKTAPPFREAIFTITFGKGIDPVAAVFDECLSAKIIKRKGAYYDIKENRCQGKAGALDFLRENPDILKELEDQIKDRLMGNKEDKEDKEETEKETSKKIKKPKEENTDDSDDDSDERIALSLDDDDDEGSVESGEE